MIRRICLAPFVCVHTLVFSDRTCVVYSWFQQATPNLKQVFAAVSFCVIPLRFPFLNRKLWCDLSPSNFLEANYFFN